MSQDRCPSLQWRQSFAVSVTRALLLAGRKHGFPPPEAGPPKKKHTAPRLRLQCTLNSWVFALDSSLHSGLNSWFFDMCACSCPIPGHEVRASRQVKACPLLLSLLLPKRSNDLLDSYKCHATSLSFHTQATPFLLLWIAAVVSLVSEGLLCFHHLWVDLCVFSTLESWLLNLDSRLKQWTIV